MTAYADLVTGRMIPVARLLVRRTNPAGLCSLYVRTNLPVVGPISRSYMGLLEAQIGSFRFCVDL
jgi:hypothetical protein